MTRPVIPTDQWPDEFKGDNAKLIGCINALLSMDAAGALVPHGIGAHARSLLAAAAQRLAPAPAIDLEQFRPAVFCMRNYTGVLPRSYWDKGSKAFSDEADRLLAQIDGHAKCLTCSGHGLIGSASTDGGTGYGEACLDCNGQPPKGEVK